MTNASTKRSRSDEDQKVILGLTSGILAKLRQLQEMADEPRGSYAMLKDLLVITDKLKEITGEANAARKAWREAADTHVSMTGDPDQLSFDDFAAEQSAPVGVVSDAGPVEGWADEDGGFHLGSAPAILPALPAPVLEEAHV